MTLAALGVDVLAGLELQVACVLACLVQLLAGIGWTLRAGGAGVDFEGVGGPVGVDVVAAAAGRGDAADGRCAGEDADGG